LHQRIQTEVTRTSQSASLDSKLKGHDRLTGCGSHLKTRRLLLGKHEGRLDEFAPRHFAQVNQCAAPIDGWVTLELQVKQERMKAP
jgi:hypothetical protein